MLKKKSRSFIPMRHWEREIGDGIGEQIKEVEETTHWPLNPPPTTEEIATYCRELKNGRAPGLDRINAELIKEGTEELARNIKNLLALAWATNKIPRAWTETIQIPIPKKRSPKETSDYRRITLCNTIYKIYTKHLAKALSDIIEELPYYQAAFIKNRSTDDHMFTIRRVLEEKWRGGQKVYLLSLDLAIAFDSVDCAIIPTILKHRAVPGWLTNRIIAACLTEETSILWYGQKTTKRRKTRGVKQGDPLSPKLFNLVLHEALTTTVELLDIADFLNETTQILKSTMLDINLKKSAILIRNPLDSQTGGDAIGNNEDR